MPSVVQHIVAALLAFVATNVDDLFVLAVLFALPAQKPRDVVIGQYVGFFALLVIVAPAAAAGLLIRKEWLVLLAVVPLALAIKAIVSARRAKAEEPVALASKASSLGILTVAGITLGNGGDNFVVYIPLFSRGGASGSLALAAVSLVCVGAWCFVGYRLARLPAVSAAIRRYEHVLTPLMLIALAVWIVVDGLS